MITKICSAIAFGLESQKIEIEIDSRRGIPGIKIIGLPNKATKEAKERIISALLNCEIKLPSKKVLINLAPADLPKTSSNFELAMAVGLARMNGLITTPMEKTLFLGELSLSGDVKGIKGILPLVLYAKKMGFEAVVFPKENVREVNTISNIKLFPISHLKEYIDYGKNFSDLKQAKLEKFDQGCKHKNANADHFSFDQIIGQSFAKRALEIAVAGGHHVLLVGNPGIGKSMLAKSILSILPALSEKQSLEVSAVYSTASSNSSGVRSLFRQRPFRAPHHSISRVGLLGGGNPIRPGEISLAHQGVLFLDEILEFSTSSLDALRQPLEDHKIVINRRNINITYPASFLLIATTNPCPCGYFQSSKHVCRCSGKMIKKYQGKLSGPLLDRIDIHIKVGDVKVADLGNYDRENKGDQFHQIAKKVFKARQIQLERFGADNDKLNSQMDLDFIKKFCVLDKKSRHILNQASLKLGLSARSYFKIIKIARTIADLSNSENILEEHILEAINLRNLLKEQNN